jgi:hypothetical protein
VSVEGVIGMLAGVIASAIESVGDYYACARLSGETTAHIVSPERFHNLVINVTYLTYRPNKNIFNLIGLQK